MTVSGFRARFLARSRRGVGAAVALLLAVSGTAGIAAFPYRAAASLSAGGFTGVTPTRLLDTREAGQGPCVNSARNLTVTGGATTVPAGASAVALNVTAVQPSLPGYLTVYPAGAARPTTSNLNFSIGQIVPNGVFVKVGAGGQITLFANAGCPHVVVDVVGYFDGALPVAPGGFTGVTPKRLLDTREPGHGPCVNGARNLTVAGGATTVPAGASAVALNVTAVQPSLPGYVTVYPAGAARPTTSNLNYSAGQVVPNNVQVKVGSGGQITLFANAGCPHLVVDVIGYYAGGSPVDEGGFIGVTPKRLIDTREPDQGPCVDGTLDLLVAGGDSTVPANASAIAINVTVVQPDSPGYLTVFPTGAPQPTASTLNYVDGQVVPNGAVMKLGDFGAISIFANAGCPDVIVDLVGYYDGTAVLAGRTVTQVSGGGEHTCALTTVGEVLCWGNNWFGQLGNDQTEYSELPMMVSGLPAEIVEISAGTFHTCARTSAGAVYCWGRNDSGELGNGTNTYSATPVAVTGLTDIAQVSAGSEHTCALTSTGTVKCWGIGIYGVLGANAPLGWSSVPLNVTGLSSATQISAGGWHTCARTSVGSAYCWGHNESGALGNDTVPVYSLQGPVPVTGLSGVTAIDAKGWHTCARTSDGSAYCWGANQNQQVDSSGMNRRTAVLVANNVVQITTGQRHTCTLRSDQSVQCWGFVGGWNGHPPAPGSATPVTELPAASGVTAISSGGTHACALSSAGKVHCWGDNYYGQLGDGTTLNRGTPVAVL